MTSKKEVRRQLMAHSLSTRSTSDVSMDTARQEPKIVLVALQKAGSFFAGTVLVALVLTLLLRG